MPIKKDSCRISERKRMKQMAAEGFHPAQISNAVSVKQHLVDSVLDGTWGEQEKQQKLDQKQADKNRAEAEARKEAQNAAATAAAMKAVLQEEGVLSPQQKAANTRKANREAAEQQAAG